MLDVLVKPQGFMETSTLDRTIIPRVQALFSNVATEWWDGSQPSQIQLPAVGIGIDPGLGFYLDRELNAQKLTFQPEEI